MHSAVIKLFHIVLLYTYNFATISCYINKTIFSKSTEYHRCYINLHNIKSITCMLKN